MVAQTSFPKHITPVKTFTGKDLRWADEGIYAFKNNSTRRFIVIRNHEKTHNLMIDISEGWIQVTDKWDNFEFVLTGEKLFLTCL